MAAPQQPISFAPEACASLSFLSIFGPMLGLAPLPRDDLERCLREPGVYRQLIEMQWQMMQPNAPCPAGDAGYAELSDHDRLAVLLALCEAVAPAVDPQDLGHLGGDAAAMVRAPSPRQPGSLPPPPGLLLCS